MDETSKPRVRVGNVRLSLFQDETDPAPLAPEDRGVYRLLVAVLERSIVDAVGDRREVKPKDQEEGLLWFEDDEDFPLPFSFSWVCEGLNVEPEKVLKLVKALRAEVGKVPKRLININAENFIRLSAMADE